MTDNEHKEFDSTVWRCLSDALRVMNEAVAMTADQGPAKAIEYVADFLNDTDGIDVEMAKACPADWLTRWNVEAKG